MADSNDTELASLTTDSDIVGGYDGNNYTLLTWDSPTNNPVLTADTAYRLYLKPTSANTINKQGITFDTEADKNSQIGGINWKWIERPTPASGWTYYPERYPWISLLLTDLSEESGGNGNGGGEGGAAFGFIG